MKNDLRFALRMIVTHRWFSLVVVVTLALGIGVNTTVFTLVNAVLFKPVPIPDGERLVVVNGQNLTRPDSRFGVSYPDYVEFRQNNRSFDGLEGIARDQAVISENDNPPERFSMARTTPGLFTLLQTPPIQGRNFSPDDGKPGAELVALISHTVWRNRYNSAPDIAGRKVRLNGSPATIIGVMPEGFKFPLNEDVWMPYVPNADSENRSNRPLQLFGLLKRGTSIESAGADFATIAQRLATAFSDKNKDIGATVRTFHDAFNNGSIRIVFLTMLGAVCFVLLIACANVACFMLSRAISRSREIAVRAAVGASRWQIIRQLLIESVALSVLGGLVGLAIAAGGVRAFDLATADVGKPYWILFEMDYTVFAYFAAISVVSGLLFGLAPALRASRVDLNVALKDGTLGSGSAASGGKLVGVLVVLQFALTVVLLAGAGLMVRSFFAAQTVNDFVPAAQMLGARLELPRGRGQRYAERQAQLNFYAELQQRLGALPGSPRVALTSNLPGLGSGQREIEIEGRPLETANTSGGAITNPSGGPASGNAANTPVGLRVSTGVHTPGYLPLINLPLLSGRDFNEQDGDPGKEVAIVTHELAAKYWPNQSPVGARFRFLRGGNNPDKTWVNIIGVCGDIVQRGQDPDAPPLVFTPLRQEPNVGMALLLRTAGDPSALAAGVQRTVQAMDQDLPLSDVRTMPGALERQQWPLKVFGTLFFSFALIALLIASVGLYAVVAQATSRRTREIGIRMALGATAGKILQLVLSRGLTQLGIGLVLGLVGAYFGTELLAKAGRLLFRTSAHDPLVFAAVTTLLLLIGIFACWLPARRASALHPVKALRQE